MNSTYHFEVQDARQASRAGDNLTRDTPPRNSLFIKYISTDPQFPSFNHGSTTNKL